MTRRAVFWSAAEVSAQRSGLRSVVSRLPRAGGGVTAREAKDAGSNPREAHLRATRGQGW